LIRSPKRSFQLQGRRRVDDLRSQLHQQSGLHLRHAHDSVRRAGQPGCGIEHSGDHPRLSAAHAGGDPGGDCLCGRVRARTRRGYARSGVGVRFTIDESLPVEAADLLILAGAVARTVSPFVHLRPTTVSTLSRPSWSKAPAWSAAPRAVSKGAATITSTHSTLSRPAGRNVERTVSPLYIMACIRDLALPAGLDQYQQHDH